MSEFATESRSSVEIGQTAKGEPVVKVKVYADSLELDAVDAASTKAVEVYKRTCQEVGA
jgi:hypothetical protein